MRPRAERRLIRMSAAWLLLTSLSACGGDPPIPTADTSCERFRAIYFSDAQIKAVEGNYDLWESAVDMIVAHNVAYEKHCLEEKK